MPLEETSEKTEEKIESETTEEEEAVPPPKADTPYRRQEKKYASAWDRIRDYCFSTSGRIGKLTYLYRILGGYFLFFCGAAISLAGSGIDLADPQVVMQPPSMMDSVITLAIVFIVACLWTCTTIKRLHDLGHSGLWAIPLVLVGMSFAGTLLTTVALSLINGDSHRNKYDTD